MPIHALGEHTPELPPPGRFWVAPGAHVIGQVRLGADVGVWFGAVLRGDNAAIEVGARTNIQENAVLHVDPGTPLHVGEGVTIGHGAIVHGCTVGDNVLVGMGAVVMNRAVIGADSLVAAAAMKSALSHLKATGDSQTPTIGMYDFNDFSARIGFEEVWAFDKRWGR